MCKCAHHNYQGGVFLSFPNAVWANLFYSVTMNRKKADIEDRQIGFSWTGQRSQSQSADWDVCLGGDPSVEPPLIFHLLLCDLFRSEMAQRAWLSPQTDKGPTVQFALFSSHICPESYEITTMLCLPLRKVLAYWGDAVPPVEPLCYGCYTEYLECTQNTHASLQTYIHEHSHRCINDICITIQH